MYKTNITTTIYSVNLSLLNELMLFLLTNRLRNNSNPFTINNSIDPPTSKDILSTETNACDTAIPLLITVTSTRKKIKNSVILDFLNTFVTVRSVTTNNDKYPKKDNRRENTRSPSNPLNSTPYPEIVSPEPLNGNANTIKI